VEFACQIYTSSQGCSICSKAEVDQVKITRYSKLLMFWYKHSGPKKDRERKKKKKKQLCVMIDQRTIHFQK